MSAMSYLFAEVCAKCREVIVRTCDPYHPELNYMRGPGPKWRAKHQGIGEFLH